MQRYKIGVGHIGFVVLVMGVLLWSITNTMAQAVTVTASGLQGYAGETFTAQFMGNGGTPPYSFSTSSTMPNGTIFLSLSGQITGVPTAAGQYTVSIIATDSNGVDSAPTNFVLCIGILMGPATIPDIVATKPYTATITTTCAAAPVGYSITAGSLPTGLTLNPTTGVISGSTAVTGPVSFEVTATDANGRSAKKTYNINSTNPVFSYSPATLANGVSGQAYSSTITIGTAGANDGTAPYTVVSQGTTSLPTGYAFTQVNGTQLRVSGTTTQIGNFNLDVLVTDANGVVLPKKFTFSVNAPSLAISPDVEFLPNATVGVGYSQQLTASGGNGDYTFTLAPGSSLPSNLTLSQAGLIDGIPRATPATYSVTVTVTDSSSPQRTGTRVYKIPVVAGATPVYSSNPAQNGIISFGLVTIPGSDVPQTMSITNGGAANLTVSVPDSGAVFTGANAGDFRFGGTVAPPFTISPGGSTVILVIICRPSNTLFASTATMTFKTNDPVRPTVSYTLLCNQVTPTSTPGVGTPTAVVAGTAGPSVQVLGRATAVVTQAPDTFATVTFVKGLSLRSGPYLGATMLGVIRPKKDYGVLAMNPGDGNGDFNWYLLVDTDNNRVGWASGRYLILKGDPSIPLTPTIFDQIDNAKDFGVRVTIFGNVNIRARPSERMPVVHTTAYGTELEVIGRTYQAGMVQWVQVRFYNPTDGRPIVGWIYYRFDAPELIKLTGRAPLDAVPIR